MIIHQLSSMLLYLMSIISSVGYSINGMLLLKICAMLPLIPLAKHNLLRLALTIYTCADVLLEIAPLSIAINMFVIGNLMYLEFYKFSHSESMSIMRRIISLDLKIYVIGAFCIYLDRLMIYFILLHLYISYRVVSYDLWYLLFVVSDICIGLNIWIYPHIVFKLLSWPTYYIGQLVFLHKFNCLLSKNH